MNAKTDRSTPSEGAVEAKPRLAWQPLTFPGVAAFAEAPFTRLLLVQTIVALLAAASVMWALHRAWYPVITDAIRHLPMESRLNSGNLAWAAASPVCLAEGKFLAVSVDLDHGGKARSPAQVQVEFGRRDLKVSSVFGDAWLLYPAKVTVPFNQPEVGPWWGAWAPVLLAIAGLAVVLGLLAVWASLATVYALPVWLLSFFADRTCSLMGAWRLAGAALMPGALFMSGVILLYGWGALDLVRLVVATAVHVLIGWVYLLASPFCLPQCAAAKQAPKNPFA